jgi:hypothetical protein
MLAADQLGTRFTPSRTSLLDPVSAKLEEARAGLDDHVRRGQRVGITVLYALLCRALIAQCRPDGILCAVDAAQKSGA